MVIKFATLAIVSIFLATGRALAESLGDPVKVSNNKTKVVILYYPDTIRKNSDKSGAMMVIHFQEDGSTKATGRIIYKKSDCQRKQGEYVFLRDGAPTAYRGSWDAQGLDRFAVVAAGICVKAWGIYVL